MENVTGQVGGRGFPYRRILSLGAMGMGPGQIPELFVRRRIRRIFLKNAKTVFGDETYLEKRLGIVKHGFMQGFPRRIFLVFSKNLNSLNCLCFGGGGPFLFKLSVLRKSWLLPPGQR